MKKIVLQKYGEHHLRLYNGTTFRNWKLFLSVLKKYAPDSTTDFSLHDFYEFKRSLLTHGYSNNSITNFTDKLKSLLRAASREGYKITADITLMTHQSDDTQAIYLTEKEIRKIHRLKLSGISEVIKDYFVIGCFTGLRFSDYSRFNAGHIRCGKIYMFNKKTNINVVIPTHPIVAEIMNRCNDNLPSAPSQGAFNMHLPFIGAMAGIREKIIIEKKKGDKIFKKEFFKYEFIKSHTARRSAATNMYLCGIPTFRIMLITGHTTEQSFFKYIRIRRDENADELSKHPFFK